MTVQEIQERLAPIVAQMAKLPDAECQRLIDSLRFDLETETSFDLADIPFDPTLRATDELDAMAEEAIRQMRAGEFQDLVRLLDEIENKPAVS